MTYKILSDMQHVARVVVLPSAQLVKIGTFMNSEEFRDSFYCSTPDEPHSFFYNVYHPQCHIVYRRMLMTLIEINQLILPNPVIVVCHLAYVPTIRHSSIIVLISVLSISSTTRTLIVAIAPFIVT